LLDRWRFGLRRFEFEVTLVAVDIVRRFKFAVVGQHASAIIREALGSVPSGVAGS